jgi:hypothetical protein
LVLLSMESPASEDSPRVTRRRTTDGENPPPLEFDRGWSSFRGRKSSAGLSSSLPLAFVTPPTPPHIPTLGLSFALVVAAPPVQQAKLPATLGKTTTLGVCMTPLHISPLPHYSAPSLPSPLHSPKLALSLAGITSGRRVSLPATSSNKSRAGVSFALRPTLPCRTALVHALPNLQHYSFFFHRLPDFSGACK